MGTSTRGGPTRTHRDKWGCLQRSCWVHPSRPPNSASTPSRSSQQQHSQAQQQHQQHSQPQHQYPGPHQESPPPDRRAVDPSFSSRPQTTGGCLCTSKECVIPGKTLAPWGETSHRLRPCAPRGDGGGMVKSVVPLVAPPDSREGCGDSCPFTASMCQGAALDCGAVKGRVGQHRGYVRGGLNKGSNVDISLGRRSDDDADDTKDLLSVDAKLPLTDGHQLALSSARDIHKLLHRHRRSQFNHSNKYMNEKGHNNITSNTRHLSPPVSSKLNLCAKAISRAFTHAMGALGGPLAVAVLVCALFLVLAPPAWGMESPPRISRDAMPNTSFTCDDKASGGYYADPEAECQMFHVCVRVSEDEIRDHKFLCPNDTIFDQQNFICASWWDTDCKKSEHYYSKNDLFRENDPWASPDIAETTSPPELVSQTPSEEELYYEYLLEYENSKKQASPLPEEYDYQYYDFGSGGEDSSSGKSGRGNNFSYDDRPPLARSVSESSSSSNVLSPSKGYVISTHVGSQSTIKPLLLPITQAVTTTKGTTAVTTTTERRTSAPTTERTTTTTQSSPYKSPFAASFNVGKPVVSVSSTSSRLEVSSPRYESSTPQYGFFSVQLPSTTTSYKPRPSTTTTTTTTTTPRPIDTTTKGPYTTLAAVRSTTSSPEPAYEDVKEFEAEDLASFSDFEDPFADIDWKRDPSSVTATTKTRYETDFGPTASERRPPPSVFPIGRRRVVTPEAADAESVEKEPLKSTRVTSSSSSSVGLSSYVTATRTDRNPRGRVFSNGSITGRRRGTIREETSLENGKPRRFFTGPSRQDFSNFRYFKTAFGSTESPKESTRPNRSRQSTGRPSDSQFSRRSSNVEAVSSDRPARIASRNTRYSIYAR